MMHIYSTLVQPKQLDIHSRDMQYKMSWINQKQS